METYSTPGVHERRYSNGNGDETIKNAHTPFILTNHLIENKIKILEKDG